MPGRRRSVPAARAEKCVRHNWQTLYAVLLHCSMHVYMLCSPPRSRPIHTVTTLQPVIVPPACRHTATPCNTTLSYQQTKPCHTIPYHTMQHHTIMPPNYTKPNQTATCHSEPACQAKGNVARRGFHSYYPAEVEEHVHHCFFFFLCLALPRCIVRVVIDLHIVFYTSIWF